MNFTDFKERLLAHLDSRTRSGGLLFSLYIDIFTEETSNIDLRKVMNKEIESLVSNMQYTYIIEKSDSKHLTFLDCSTFEVIYNNEIVVIGSKYTNGKIESFTVEKKPRF